MRAQTQVGREKKGILANFAKGLKEEMKRDDPVTPPFRVAPPPSEILQVAPPPFPPCQRNKRGLVFLRLSGRQGTK